MTIDVKYITSIVNNTQSCRCNTNTNPAGHTCSRHSLFDLHKTPNWMCSSQLWPMFGRLCCEQPWSASHWSIEHRVCWHRAVHSNVEVGPIQHQKTCR